MKMELRRGLKKLPQQKKRKAAKALVRPGGFSNLTF
jgi:hypothetical protein